VSCYGNWNQKLKFRGATAEIKIKNQNLKELLPKLKPKTKIWKSWNQNQNLYFFLVPIPTYRCHPEIEIPGSRKCFACFPILDCKIIWGLLTFAEERQCNVTTTQVIAWAVILLLSNKLWCFCNLAFSYEYSICSLNFYL